MGLGLGSIGGLVSGLFNPGSAYDAAIDAAGRAKGESKALGDKLWGQQMEGLGKGLGQFGSAEQAYQGLANQGPGQLEQFYAQQLGGAANPYWDRRMGQADKGLNAQMAARGGYNSGGAFAALGNQRGAMEGERFGQMGQLAGGAQAAQQNRLGQTFQAGMGLGSAKAGLTSDFYGRGSSMYGQQGENAINAGIAQGGYRTQQDLANQAGGMDLLKLGVGAATGGASFAMPGAAPSFGGGGGQGYGGGGGMGMGYGYGGQAGGGMTGQGGLGGVMGGQRPRNPLYPWAG